MKKLILAISAIALFSTACNKTQTIVEQPSQTTKQTRSSDDVEPTLEFSRSIQIFSEDGTSSMNATVSAHTQEVLNRYLDEIKFVFEPLSNSPQGVTETQGEAIEEEGLTNSNDILKVSLDDEHLGAYRLYAKNKTRNIWGRTWKYGFDFDSQKDNVSISWIPNMTPNDKVGFTVGFKMCGLCGKNILVNSWVDAGYMSATYNKPSKRLYVRLYTDFYNNYNVNFF